MAIATDLFEAKLPFDISIIYKIQFIGAYLNFFVNPQTLATELIPIIATQKERFGAGENKRQRLMIESPGPNTNKPLHLGHVRNMLLGNALEEIARFA